FGHPRPRHDSTLDEVAAKDINNALGGASCNWGGRTCEQVRDEIVALRLSHFLSRLTYVPEL
ncbi:MAG: hypothetical protein JWP10_1224, partial [Nocardioidaceae bacterium]|nr:hypothetical protein [Nocardioidaceae bacterium]